MKKITRWEILALILILAFAFFIRIYALGSPSFWVDEAISANAAKKILESGRPVFDSDWNYRSAYFLHYSMAFMMIFSVSEFSVRFVSVVFGLLTIVLAFFLGREYSKWGGIIASLFFALFYLEVFFSRQSRYYQLFQLAFFASLYFLYKSKERSIFLIPATFLFFIALDTHATGLILAPFFIFHILYFNKKQWFFSIFFFIPLIKKFIPTTKLSSGYGNVAVSYMSSYFSYTRNMLYLLILFVPGILFALRKNKRLTLLIALSSIFALFGIFSLQTFAFRYAYFFIFPLLLYSALFFSYLVDKHGKIMLIPLVFIIIIPSNIFFNYSYVNVVRPIEYNLNDPSAPFTDYKILPPELISELKYNTTLVTYFSSDVEWYIRKPDYVLPFSLDGRGSDQISFANSRGEIVDRYSGAMILSEELERPYNVIAPLFSTRKLTQSQRNFHNALVRECEVAYSAIDVRIYRCL
jgi:hypothetical protein